MAAGGVFFCFLAAALCIVPGAYIVGGIGWALLAGGFLLLIITGFLFVAHWQLQI